jgi:hypothetical protein
MKWRLRSCPRCGGDMFVGKDLYGWYESCLQCGYYGELKNLDEFGQNPTPKDERPVVTQGHETRGK